MILCECVIAPNALFHQIELGDLYLTLDSFGYEKL